MWIIDESVQSFFSHKFKIFAHHVKSKDLKLEQIMFISSLVSKLKLENLSWIKLKLIGDWWLMCGVTVYTVYTLSGTGKAVLKDPNTWLYVVVVIMLHSCDVGRMEKIGNSPVFMHFFKAPVLTL